jgi:hypothetical protein
VAIHQIAVQLFKLDTSHHKNDGIASWEPLKDDTFWALFPQGAPPTLFRHEWYSDYDKYPDGVADVVGYWAEARIMGGVVLFDRRDSKVLKFLATLVRICLLSSSTLVRLCLFSLRPVRSNLPDLPASPRPEAAAP